ncbi:PfkB family carbohydrate kinase [Limosilactobacillus ingluviei]|uniref:PfkB family carbohydrate kinase n=1 Tax=Limosilactobacillus ingluviei TaxID=148604 RepID=UPI0024BA4F5C|nr:PfkB family carbohydrate kinase [Limosilactobacillus ingluviei]
MPTEREQQILDLIRQNPLISQKELAELLGMTRAGLASHISRLIKKGLIVGKGYILPPNEHITVIGAVNMDIAGTLQSSELIPKGSNSGAINNQLGGVGRNVAANLAALGVATNLITVYGSDQNGEQFAEDAIRRGIDISSAQQLPNQATAMYMYINYQNGERFVGLDDMTINQAITPEFLEARLPLINGSKQVIIDSNLAPKTIRWIYAHVTVPIIAKAVSVTKSQHLLQDNVNLASLVVNGVEGTIFTGEKMTTLAEAKQGADSLYKMFHCSIYLYVDNIGIVQRTVDGTNCYQYQSDTEVVNTNGLGAAIAAGLAYATLKHKSTTATLTLVSQLAELTMETAENVNTKATAQIVDQ